MKRQSASVVTVILFIIALVCSCSQPPSPSVGVQALEIENRVLLGEGVPFGEAGPYETLAGHVRYTLDPTDPRNSQVTDAQYAAGSDGYVHYSADVVIVKPVDMARSNGTLLYHVVNRGNFDTRVLTSEPWSEVASSKCGSRERMGRLMQKGFTIVFSGWQADLSQEEHLRLFVPEVIKDGNPVSGQVLAEFSGVADKQVAYLGHPRDWLKILAVDPEAPIELRVHDSYADEGEVIKPDKWSFSRLDDAGSPIPDNSYVYVPEGYESGKIYTLRYWTNDSPLMGLCFPAVRELVTFLSNSDSLNPLLDSSGQSSIKHRLAYGSSQSGRFLRNYLYQGFNRSLGDKRVFDGIFSNVPGCRMGFFNYRHAQPSRASGFFPNFDFPFTDLPTSDPVTGQTGGILERVPEAFQPKVFYVHHSGEYWSGGAALTHVTLGEYADVVLPANIRIYSFSGTAHGFAELSEGRPEAMPEYLLPFNPNPTYLIENPLLEALAEWVASDQEPPPSSYPRTDRKELVWFEEFTFPEIPEITSPEIIEVHPRFDWGPRYKDGIIDNPLPGIGVLYPILVPTVGPDENELGGIRSPHVTVPVASYTGWNYPSSSFQGVSKTCAASLTGAWLPFSATRVERRKRGDSRESLEERYSSLEDYLGKLRQAAEALISKKLMFEEDLDLVLEQGEAMYEYVRANGSWQKADN